MPRSDAPPLTRGVVLRGFGFGLAIALGAVGVWLIVTSTTQKRLELGVLTGLWGLLLGAFSMFGSRRTAQPPDDANSSSATDQTGVVDLRTSSAVERADDAATRRAYEARLEHMLRREIQATMTREVSSLRLEIAQLRSELLEKVGGQLRLERIETTRVIGSDLEALQHEVRQLTVAARDTVEMVSAVPDLTRTRQLDPLRPIVETARVRPVSRQTADVEATPQPARVEAEPAQTIVQPPVPVAAPAPPAPPAPQSEPSPLDFPALPRLSPFNDFGPEPGEDDYAGRRRHRAVPPPPPLEPDAEIPPDRHADSDAEPARRHRHRRASDSEQTDDLLARLLAREAAR